MKVLVFTCAALAAPFSVLAEERAAPVSRDDCTPLYTVQKKLCSVENVWRCDTSGGTIFINEAFGPDGHRTATYYNEDYFQIAQDPPTRQVQENAGDPFSLSALLENGSDKIDERGKYDLLADGTPMKFRVQGQARLMGETVEISDKQIERAEVQLLGRVGELKYLMTSETYIDRETGTMFGGTISYGPPLSQTRIETDPVSLIREGEDGFMAEIGVHDCDGASG